MLVVLLAGGVLVGIATLLFGVAAWRFPQT
jgi:hypothetical protein